ATSNPPIVLLLAMLRKLLKDVADSEAPRVPDQGARGAFGGLGLVGGHAEHVSAVAARQVLLIDDEVVARQLGQEFFSGEAVFGRVVEQQPVGGCGQGQGGDLVEVELPPWGEDA